MKALCYKNTLSNFPLNYDYGDIHDLQKLGFAYETENHYIHLYGFNEKLNGLSTGMTFIEGKSKNIGVTLVDWVHLNFGAADLTESLYEVGESVKGVWRPGIYEYSQIRQAIGFSQEERHLSEQAVRVLIDKLDEIFLFVEPHETTKLVYSHKIRELLILSCTEVENFWTSFLSESNINNATGRYSTNDYVRLKDKLFLSDYEFNLISYPGLGSVRPFLNWNFSNPTQSLFWYDAYNKTKHDRKNNFNHATLWNAINAIVACLILHLIKFGPYALLQGTNQFSSVVKQHFDVQFGADVDCQKSFYIPKIILPNNVGADKMTINAEKFIQEFVVRDFII